jgi:hypothetical protein
VKPQIVCHYDVEEVGAPRQAVLEGLSTLFSELFGYDQSLPATEEQIPPTANRAQSLAHVVATAILRAARPGQATTPANEISIETRIAECIRQNVPIAAQILWSPKKHWITGPDSNIDLAELAALNTLLRVHANVRAIYRPGLAFTIDLEDIEFEFMEGADPDLMQSRYEYIAGLQKVIRIFALDDVFLTNKISDRAKDKQELRSWMAQMEENYHVLKDYWYESEKKGIDGFEAYESFRTLKRLGWDGAIPQEMRDHYLQRLSFRGVPEEAKVDMILRNLAGILLHYQKNLLNTRSSIQPIKFSFIPSAPGAPSKLNSARIDLRFVSRRLCSLVGSAAPWSTKGLFRERHGKITLTFRSLHTLMEPGTKLAAGHLTMSRESESLKLRADFLIQEKTGGHDRDASLETGNLRLAEDNTN